MQRQQAGTLTGREADPLMAAGELDVEVGNQRVDVVVPLHLEAEWGRERQVFGLHCVDVHLLDKKDKMPSDQMLQVSFSHPLCLCPRSIQGAENDPPTLTRQELLTSCLGSTTSTRGSLIATSLMQDISKPYTFSHPDRDKTRLQLQ